MESTMGTKEDGTEKTFYTEAWEYQKGSNEYQGQYKGIDCGAQEDTGSKGNGY
jgi:hypothetical protein